MSQKKLCFHDNFNPRIKSRIIFLALQAIFDEIFCLIAGYLCSSVYKWALIMTPIIILLWPIVVNYWNIIIVILCCQII